MDIGTATRSQSLTHFVLLVIALICAWPGLVLAAELHVLALQGEGSATIVIDQAAREAIILDGGRRGEAGLPGARVAGKDVLAYLIDNGISRVYVSCSHPDSDHMGGLRDVVVDPRMRVFKKVGFVDNGMPPRPGIPLLADLYAAKFDLRPTDVLHVNATNQNAFARLGLTSKRFKVSNYVYDPKAKASVHDAAVIVQIQVAGNRGRMIVDFDDASQALIDRWVSDNPRVHVLLLPHHGSKNNRIEELLKSRSSNGLEDVIITVNRQNRYRHPAPNVLLSLLKSLGPDHVHLTDSDAGDNVVIDSSGRISEASRARSRAHLIAILAARVEQQKLHADQLRQKGAATDRLERAEQGIRDLDEARRLVEAGGGPRDRLPAFPALSALLAGRDAAATKGRKDDFFGLRRYAFLDQRSRLGPEPPGASPSPGDGGRSPGEGSSYLAGPSRGKGGNFARLRGMSVMRGFGGIILGADATGPAVTKLEWVPLSEADTVAADEIPSLYALRFTLQDGRVLDYSNVYPSELWAAYNFVQPTHRLVSWHHIPGVEGSAGGLIGKAEDEGVFWYFGVHPAIAGSSLAVAAMRVDMSISAASSLATSGTPLRSDLALDGLVYCDRPHCYATYQWYNDESTVTPIGSQLVVVPVSEPTSCLMRVRVARYDQVSEPGSSEDLSDDAPTTDDYSLNAKLGPACRDYPPLAAIDRLARLVSLFTWYTSSSTLNLPELPDSMLKQEVMSEYGSGWSMAFEREFLMGVDTLLESEAPSALQELSLEEFREVLANYTKNSDPPPVEKPSMVPLFVGGALVFVILYSAVVTIRSNSRPRNGRKRIQ